MPSKVKNQESIIFRRVLGYISRGYRDGVSGGDTGYTLYKAALILLIATGVIGGIVSGFAIPIIVAGAVTVPLFYISGLIDEHERNEQEDEKLAELEELTKEVKTLEESEFQATQSTSQEYQITDKELLKRVLKAYFTRLEFVGDSKHILDSLKAKKRTTTRQLPSQESMLRLIESVTGLDRNESNFVGKLKFFSSNAWNHDQEFQEHVLSFAMSALNISGGPEQVNEVDYRQKEKEKTLLDRIFRFGKNLMTFIARSGTGGWLVFGSSVLLGFIIAGTPIGWPIIVVGLTVALLSGGASVLYNRYIFKEYKKNLKEIDKDKNNLKTRYELLYKLHKHEKNIEKIYQGSDQDNSATSNGHRTDFIQYFEFASTARKAISPIIKQAYGLGLGFLIGASVAALILLLLATVLPPLGVPLLALTIAGLVGGTLYGVRYGYFMGKANKREVEAEQNRDQQLNQKCCDYQIRLDQLRVQSPISSDEYRIENLLKRSKRVLLKQLLDEFNRYDDKPSQASPNIAHLLEKKEKIFLKIEEITGIKRLRNDGIPDNNDASFYDKLTWYLQKDKTLNAVNSVQAFKEHVLNPTGELPANREINPQKPAFTWTWAEIKPRLREVNRFIASKHIYPLLAGALAVAFPLAFVLFGPVAPIPIFITAAIVIGIYVASRVCDSKAAKHARRLDNIEKKFSLIDITTTLGRKNLDHIEEQQKAMDSASDPRSSLPPKLQNGTGQLNNNGTDYTNHTNGIHLPILPQVQKGSVVNDNGTNGYRQPISNHQTSPKERYQNGTINGKSEIQLGWAREHYQAINPVKTFPNGNKLVRSNSDPSFVVRIN
jgi:hypothetical protein